MKVVRPPGRPATPDVGPAAGEAVGPASALATLVALVAVSAALPGPSPVLAQEPDSGEGVSGLAVAGARLEPDVSPRHSGFDLFTARVGLRGRAAPWFRYHFQAGAGEDLSGVELLDARLSLPLDSRVRISVGQFKAPFGEEALRDKRDLRLLDRAQAISDLAPGRQVGLELAGTVWDRKLTYRTGLFNGDGRTSENPGGGVLWTGRVAYNSVGPAEYYDDLVVQVGASAAASSDSILEPDVVPPVPGAGPGPGTFVGDRVLLGADAKLTYRGAFLQGEYVWAELRPEAGGSGGGAAPDAGAEGWYAEAGYSVWGAVELLARWDSYRPPAAGRRDFLVLGASLWTSLESRLAFQVAIQADGPRLSPSPAGIPTRAPGGLTDGQATLRLQVGF